MTDKHESYLCVGGPRAGWRVDAKRGAGFRTAVSHHTSQQDPNSIDYTPNKVPTVEHVQYRADTLHTPQGDVSFWVPEGQTPLETISILLAVYEQVAIKARTEAA